MSPETGRLLWTLLHAHAKGAPSPESAAFYWQVWLKIVEENSGCRSCFRELQRFLHSWPPDFAGDFYLWSLCLHDWVNVQLGRKPFLPDFTVSPLRARGLI